MAMGSGTFLGYTIGFTILMLMLTAIGIWGSFQPDFDGWKVLHFSGPFYQIANILFFYAGILHDVAFIRTVVVLGNIFIAAFLLFGTPGWPHIWNSELAIIRPDTLIWGIASVAVNAVPMFRQFRFDDSKVKFHVNHKYESWAETVWREWWRRSGMPRTDFNEIVCSGEFIEVTQGTDIPLKRLDLDASDLSSSSTSSDGFDPADEDIFYYIVTGQVALTPAAESGVKGTMLDQGHFLDGATLMTYLGQSSVIMAMQQTSAEAVVASEKALLLRWSGPQLLDRSFKSNGYAAECLRMVVASATSDSLYFNCIKESGMEVYRRVEETRQEFARSPLPKNAGNVQRSFFKQFWYSHMSLYDLWKPSPRQRVINAVRTGSREIVFFQNVHTVREEMDSLHRAASGLQEQ